MIRARAAGEHHSQTGRPRPRPPKCSGAEEASFDLPSLLTGSENDKAHTPASVHIAVALPLGNNTFTSLPYLSSPTRLNFSFEDGLPWHFILLSPLSARSPRKWCKASVCAEWWVCTLSWAHRKVCGQWSPIKNTHTPFSNTLPWNKVREVAARRPIKGSFFPWSSENKWGGFTASETDVLQWPSTLSF